MKKKIEQPNAMYGYDDKGELIMAYWQKEPFKVRVGMNFRISRWKWWNPIWRFSQWRMLRKPIQYGDWAEKVASSLSDQKKEGSE